MFKQKEFFWIILILISKFSKICKKETQKKFVLKKQLYTITQQLI